MWPADGEGLGEERASGAGSNASQYLGAGLRFGQGCGQVKRMPCGIGSRFLFAIPVTSKRWHWCQRIPIPDSRPQCQHPNGTLGYRMFGYQPYFATLKVRQVWEV